MENRINIPKTFKTLFVSFRAVTGLGNEVNDEQSRREVVMTRNEILYQQNLETNRSNVAREIETARANRAGEAETARANQAREAETERSNRAKESQAWASLQEQHRHATVTERQADRTQQEAERSNRAKESISWGQLGEQRRANLANEQLKARQVNNQSTYWDESLQEQERSNRAKEQQAAYDTEANKFLSLYNATSRESIARLDRESQESIHAAMNEVSKRGQNLQLIGKGIEALSRMGSDAVRAVTPYVTQFE